MTIKIKELFDGLNKLCEENDNFYYAEQNYGEHYTIRSYSYRLASWNDFKLNYAKDSRGTAFVFDKRKGEWNLFTRSFKKFHNLGEGISKEEFMEDEPLYSYEKLDGSLIMCGIIDDQIVAKSKTTINSYHAIKATELINNNEKLKLYIKSLILNNQTPIFELVGPDDFKIVLPYEKIELIYLGSISNEDYKINAVIDQSHIDLFKSYNGVKCAKVYKLSWDELLDNQKNNTNQIEGFVVHTKNGICKVKTKNYVNLHHIKSHINVLSNLISLIISDKLDDVIPLVDELTLSNIYFYQEIIINLINIQSNELLNNINDYVNYKDNRKDFIMKYKNSFTFNTLTQLMKIDESDINIDIIRKLVSDNLLYKCRTHVLAKNFLLAAGIKYNLQSEPQ